MPSQVQGTIPSTVHQINITTAAKFEGKGDERPGTLPADIIFSVEEKIHPLFKRDGNDLELGVEVPLVQALTGCTIPIPLDKVCLYPNKASEETSGSSSWLSFQLN